MALSRIPLFFKWYCKLLTHIFVSSHGIYSQKRVNTLGLSSSEKRLHLSRFLAEVEVTTRFKILDVTYIDLRAFVVIVGNEFIRLFTVKQYSFVSRILFRVRTTKDSCKSHFTSALSLVNEAVFMPESNLLNCI